MGRLGSVFGWRNLLVLAAGSITAAVVLWLSVFAPGGHPRQSGRIVSRTFAEHAEVHHDANRVAGKVGGEPRATGPESPASAFVAERAFPRNYVDDRRAAAERHAFDQLPRTPPRSAFNSR